MKSCIYPFFSMKSKLFTLRFLYLYNFTIKSPYERDSFHPQHCLGAGDQLTIIAYHHHEGAPLTVALMSGKRYFAHVLHASLAGLPKLRKLLLFRE